MSRSRIARRWAPALAALTLLVTRPAAAQEEETREPPSEAIEQFQAGQEHYLAGRYQEAAVALERALELDPGSPTLIFNLTRVYELMGELDKAIEFGQEYLRLVPEDDSEERANAERTLRRLEGARDWLALREAQEPPDLRRLAPRVLVRDRGVADLPFWVTLGAGAALLVGGGVVGGFALRAQNQADDSILRTEGDQSAWRDRV
ncbi:MAG TPA: tetratricopeptide repeat protein, partial [Polyangiaceae bacterium LLY-WYZ-15_(1-7)]|nr:tetratricopeptide repeat protein [Polyangiaceae bacterium LLY-WYZ-15_(1-7)]